VKDSSTRQDLASADTELEATIDASANPASKAPSFVDSSADTVDARAEGAPPSLHTGDEDLPLDASPRIGRFMILEVLGRGGMGTVYAAWDPKLDRRVALKILRRGAFGDCANVRRRILAEARAMAQLAHPNVIGLHDVLEQDGHIILAMEFVDGGTLRSLLESRPGVDTLLDILVDAGRGLAAAHAQGILHRDFKPDNVLLGRDGRARVADFGIASLDPNQTKEKSLLHAKPLPTTVTTLAGTMGYIAPEALRREPVSAISDQFSFCVSAWEALTGSLPPEGKKLPPLPGLDPSIRRVFQRGMSDKPEERYRDMEALLDALLWARQSRKRWLIRGLGAALGFALLVACGFWARYETTVCEEGNRLAEQSWGSARREAVKRAFQQDGLDDATRLYGELEGRVSERVEAWRSGALSTCQELRHAEPLQRVNLAGRLACFHRRFGLLQAVTARWAAADAAALARTPIEVDGLRRYDDCPLGTTDGYAVLPEDPAQAMEAQALRNELDGLSARLLMMTSANSAALLGELRGVAERSTLAGDPFSTAGARRLEAEIVCGNGGQPQVCMDCLKVAASEALAANDTETAVLSLASLAVYRAMAGQGEQARFEAALANGLLTRLRHPPQLSAEVHVNVGIMLRSLGDLPAAAAELREGMNLRTQIYGQDSLETAQAGNDLATVEYDMGRFAEAEKLYKDSLDLRTRRLGPKHSSRLVLLHNLGTLYTDTERFAEALALFDDVLSQMPDIAGKPHPRRRTVQSFRGAALLGLGRLDEAEAALRESLSQTEALLGVESPESVKALVTLVEVDLARGNVNGETILRAARAVRLSEAKAKTGALLAHARIVQARVLAVSAPSEAGSLLDLALAALPKGMSPLPADQRSIDKVRASVSVPVREPR